jgi:hypothetical protein
MVKNQLGFEMDGLIQNLDNYDINEEEILEMKEKMKLMDKKLKEKNKHKTITISGYDHTKIKNYCISLDINIGDWVSKILLEKIESERCTEEFEQEEFQEIEKKEIIERYINSKNLKNLLKTDKIIFNNQFEFKGYSSLDGKPIYQCDTKGVKELLNSFDVDYVLASKREVGNGIYHNLDLEVELLIPEKLIPTNE